MINRMDESAEALFASPNSMVYDTLMVDDLFFIFKQVRIEFTDIILGYLINRI
jgi:hypothetical protein